MQKVRPALQSSKGRSTPWGGAKLVNAFAEVSEGDKVETYAVMAIPGLTAFATPSSAEGRGVHRMGTTLYTVVGTSLYSVSGVGVMTSLGTIGGTGAVRMVDNGTQLAICPNTGTGYVLDTGVIYSGISNLPTVSDVAYIDGYFVWSAQDSDQFIISSLYDGLSYDPLDVATAEGDPDAIVGVINDHRELQFFGAGSVEIWVNTGAAAFPFERQGNAFIERGCLSRDSLCKVDNSVFFVGDDRIVYRLNGYTPQRVSTHAIETAIEAATWFIGYTYTQVGHKFYVLSTDVGTYALDMATNLWHERKSYTRDNHRVAFSETAYGSTLMQDIYTGAIYTPSLDVYDEDGDQMDVTVEIPTIEKDRDKATLYAIELHCETGVGNADTPAPVAIMEYSKDGGRSWSNQMSRNMGAVGTYTTRAVWRPNVEFRQLAVRFTMQSKTRRFVLGYYADVR